MKLGGLLKSLAPTIASAAGGPMAGMAVKMAAQKLGIPNATANEIEDLIERVMGSIRDEFDHGAGLHLRPATAEERP